MNEHDSEREKQDNNTSEPAGALDEALSAPDLSAEVEQARAQAAEWQDKYLRKLAEFDNFRKRTRQEQESLRDFVAETIILGLLPVMDDFERMLTLPGDSSDPFRAGAELIYGKLRAFLESYNVKKIECVGKPFDPGEHDALLTQPVPGFPAGTVMNVIAPGYRMGERVIRHAQVVVSSEPEDDSESGGD